MDSDVSSGTLAGVGVLVTRPVEQAELLCELIAVEGGSAIRFPVLEIVDPENITVLRDIIRRLDSFDVAIFISANAVNKALNLILSQRSMPSHIRLAVVGRSSAKALMNLGLMPDFVPVKNYNSESLLALAPMHAIQGKRVVIFRGNGGREILAQTLAKRGANVEYGECYRRIQPKADVNHLLKHWTQGDIDIVSVTSNEGLRNLCDMVGQLGRQWLQKTPLVVVSTRAVRLANELGFEQHPIICEASNEAIVDAIVGWRAAQVA